jgi:hypothetical protein
VSIQTFGFGITAPSGFSWATPKERIDPYFVWFDRTTSMSFSNLDLKRLELLVELADDAGQRLVGLQSLRDLGWDRRFGIKSTNDCPKFLTGTLAVGAISNLIGQVQDSTKSGIQRFELASARFLPAGGLGPNGIDPFITLNAIATWYPQTRARLTDNDPGGLFAPLRPQEDDAKSLGQLAGPMVFVVDDLCGLGHAQRSGRLRSLWHQGKTLAPGASATASRAVSSAPVAPPASDAYWNAADRTGPATPGQSVLKPGPQAATDRERSGAVLSFEPGAPGAKLLDEEEHTAHQLAAYKYPMLRWSHGSAVMQAIAGDQPQHAPHLGEPDGSDQVPPCDNVHFVQLPGRAVLDTSGGSLAGFALDALHRAVRLAKRDGCKSVVVNLSYGTHSGPHDGSSMFERAVKDLLDVYNGKEDRVALHVVLPAGNTHLARCHAHGTLGAKGAASSNQKLYWKVLPDDETDNFLEIWFDSNTPDLAGVQVRLTAPDGLTNIGPVARGNAAEWVDKALDSKDASVLRAAVIYPKSAAQGQSGTMALVALAPTMRRADYGVGERYKELAGDPSAGPGVQRVRMEAPAGVWTVELINEGGTAASFHAWVQRDDAAPGRTRSASGYKGRQSHLLDNGESTPMGPRFTLNGIATASHPRLWIVGAMDETAGLARYSAAGPDRGSGQRFEGPNVVITVDPSRNNPGRRVGGVLSGSRVKLSGTSIGAAVFTRMLTHALTVGGHTWPMQWCPGPAGPVPAPPVAGEPELAHPVHRGGACELKLRHIDQLVLPSKHKTACAVPAEMGCKPKA